MFHFIGGDFGATSRLDFDGVEWYADPLCGASCTTDPSWENALGGEVVGAAGSDAFLCFSLLNEVWRMRGGIACAGPDPTQIKIRAV